MSKDNLLKETMDIIEDNSKSVYDVKWVGDIGEYAISWGEFEKIANVTYNSGFGGNEIIGSLLVVGSDWWLSRGEYDGSEWWDFHTLPIKPDNPKKFTKVKMTGFQRSIKDLNEKSG